MGHDITAGPPRGGAARRTIEIPKAGGRRTLCAYKNGDRAGTQNIPCHGTGKEIAHRMITVSSHHEHARTKLLYLFQQDLGGSRFRNHVMQLVSDSMRPQEIAGEPGEFSG